VVWAWAKKGKQARVTKTKNTLSFEKTITDSHASFCDFKKYQGGAQSLSLILLYFL
jgi:hypothetical protein